MPHPLDPYPTPEIRDATTRELARTLGGETHVIGQTVEGRPLLAACVPAKRLGAPRVLVTGNIHGVEWVSCQVAMGMLQELRGGDVGLQQLQERAELWVIPCMNPDGYHRTFVSEGHGSMAGLRTNANGVDLNRNFPLPPGELRKRLPGAGSLVPGNATYVGTGPLSEPETQAIERLMVEQKFHASINVHSFLGKVIPARALTGHHARTYKKLAKLMAAAQATAYGRLSSAWFDTFTGELEDHQHHAHNMWAACMETFTFAASVRQHLRAPNLFWRFNPRDPQRWVKNDVPAVTAFLLAALDEARPDP